MGGLLSRQTSATTLQVGASLSETQLLDYLNTLLQMSGPPSTSHCTSVWQQDPFAYLIQCVTEHPDWQTIVIPTFQHGNYGLVCYQAITKTVLHVSHQSTRDFVKIRLPAECRYVRLPLITLNHPAHSSTWLLITATWCLLSSKVSDTQQRIQDFENYMSYVKDGCHIYRISLDDWLRQTLDCLIIPMTQPDNQLAAQQLFWLIFDDARKAECILSTTLQRQHLYYLFDFSSTASQAILKRFLASTTPDLIEDLLKKRLNAYEAKALLRRMMAASGEIPANARVSIALPWQRPPYVCEAPYFTLAIDLCQSSPDFNTPQQQRQLLRNMLITAMFATSPGATLITLFGGPAHLRFRLDALYPCIDLTLGPHSMDVSSFSLCFFDFTALTPEHFDADTPWLGYLLEACLELPEFDVKNLFFWLLAQSYAKLSDQGFRRLAQHLILLCSQIRHTSRDHLRIYIASSLLCYHPDIALPLLLNQEEQLFVLEGPIIGRSILQFCRSHHFPLISFFVQYHAIVAPYVDLILDILSHEKVSPALHDKSVTQLLDSSLVLPESLALLYGHHLLCITHPKKKETLHTTLQYLGYCYLTYAGRNVFSLLFNEELLHQDSLAWRNVGEVVLYAARTLQAAHDTIDTRAHQANYSLHQLILTDFFSFMAEPPHEEVFQVLYPTLKTLLKDFHAQVVSLPTICQAQQVKPPPEPPRLFRRREQRQPRAHVTFANQATTLANP